MVLEDASARPKAVRQARSVAGRQAQLDATGGRTGKTAKCRASDHVFIQSVRNGSTGDSTGHAARRGVLQATGQRKNEKGKKEK